MVTKFYKWLLFISSYAPLYLLLAINNYNFEESITVNIRKSFEDKPQFIFWLVIIVLFLISLLTVLVLKKWSLNEKMVLGKLSNFNENILSYIITYVVPLTVININDVNSMVVNLVLFLIIGYIYVNNDLIYLNVLLLIVGFRVYSDESGNKIITDLEKNELTEKVNEGVLVKYREIARGVYLIRKKQT
ncbi:hypothetical protein [Saccharococcus sp. Marseille-Q5394]|uniref:hypothetical protein n=1 Tax=Saccharococcus sp. Marseille-Q5394 TaxID=2972778 RepID=UPI0021CADBFB|nr:hypothetical protein [Saccharococcus sp. Marseille-Q5394]